MIPVRIDKILYNRLSQYIRYICAPIDLRYYVSYTIALSKWNHIINNIISTVGDETNGGSLCPYPNFSNQGKLRMVQIRDLKTKTTVWDVSFEDILDSDSNIVERVVHGIELDKCLASIDSELNESLLRSLIASCVREEISKMFPQTIKESNSEEKAYGCLHPDFGPSKGQLGEFEYVNGDLGRHSCEWLHKFGTYNDVRMYVSSEHTYCLMRREDNGTLFFAEIVPAPELGDNETKFQPRKPHDVPIAILRDAQELLRKAKSRRI